MNNRKISRSPELDTEKCVRNVGSSRYDLITVASERLRELKRQHKNSDQYYTTVDALLDVQNGKIDAVEYMAKVDVKKNNPPR